MILIRYTNNTLGLAKNLRDLKHEIKNGEIPVRGYEFLDNEKNPIDPKKYAHLRFVKKSN